MLKKFKITSIAFIVALVPFLFLSSQATALPPDAKSCEGWVCEEDGQFCPEGVPGSGAGWGNGAMHGYICDNEEWVELIPPKAGESAHCKGWDCDTNGLFCPEGVPGASDASYVCTDNRWVEMTPQEEARKRGSACHDLGSCLEDFATGGRTGREWREGQADAARQSDKKTKGKSKQDRIFELFGK